MEVGRIREYIYSDTELDRVESEIIEEVKASSQQPIPDPDAWLDEELKQNIFLTTVDAVISWGRRASMYPVICFPACCAFGYVFDGDSGAVSDAVVTITNAAGAVFAATTAFGRAGGPDGPASDPR